MDIAKHLPELAVIYGLWLLVATVFFFIVAQKRSSTPIKTTLIGFCFALNPLITPVFAAILVKRNPFEPSREQ